MATMVASAVAAGIHDGVMVSVPSMGIATGSTCDRIISTPDPVMKPAMTGTGTSLTTRPAPVRPRNTWITPAMTTTTASPWTTAEPLRPDEASAAEIATSNAMPGPVGPLIRLTVPRARPENRLSTATPMRPASAPAPAEPM